MLCGNHAVFVKSEKRIFDIFTTITTNYRKADNTITKPLNNVLLVKFHHVTFYWAAVTKIVSISPIIEKMLSTDCRTLPLTSKKDVTNLWPLMIS